MSSSVRWALASALVLGSFLAFLVFGGGRRDEEVVRESSLDDVRVIVDIPTAYAAGYEAGRRAFMMQMGSEVEPVARYAVLKDSLPPEDGEEMSRGYVDGYHRAAESFACPR